MPEYCSFCGRPNPPYDMHHLAGEVNHSFWTVRVCKGDCHAILDALQWTRRTPRNKEMEPPDDIKFQTMVEGLSMAFGLASEYAGYTPATMAAGTIITRILKHDPNPITGKTFSMDGSYPKLKAKHAVRTAPKRTMCGENFQRVVSAMCSIMAFLVEESCGLLHPMAVMLRKMERMGPKLLFVNVSKADLLMALASCQEEIVQDTISKLSAEMGIEP